MPLNSISPSTFTTGFLITDTINTATNRDVLGGPITPSTALDVQSTLGAFCPPRMTTTQRLALTASNGMMIYDTTLNLFYVYEAGAWTFLGSGTGNVVGPAMSVNNNIAIFSGTTGKLLADGGTTVAALTASRAPAVSKYIVQTADAGLANAQALSALSTGLLKNTTVTGVLSIASANTDYYPQSGAFKGSVTTNATAAYTALATDYIIRLTHTPTGTVALTIPTVAPSNANQIYIVIDAGNNAAANNITITPVSGTINGAANVVISTNSGRLTVFNDGTNWYAN